LAQTILAVTIPVVFGLLALAVHRSVLLKNRFQEPTE
jgi:hypothetical protein